MYVVENLKLIPQVDPYHLSFFRRIRHGLCIDARGAEMPGIYWFRRMDVLIFFVLWDAVFVHMCCEFRMLDGGAVEEVDIAEEL